MRIPPRQIATPALLLCSALSLALPIFAQETSKSRFDGTKWSLVSPVYAGLDAPPTLDFSEGRVAAYAGCNRMGGEVKIEGQRFTIGQMVSTKMACDDSKMKAESAYATALQGAASFELGANGKTLLLKGTSNLSFRLTGGEAPVQLKTVTPPGIRWREGAARINRIVSPEYAGDLMVVRGGKEQKIAAKVWNFWELSDQTLVYAGSDGGGGFENEGHSLWHLNSKTGAKRKLIAEVFPIENIREIGSGLLVLSMRDGGLGAPHLNIIRRENGKSVYRQTGARLSAVRNGRLAIAILPKGETEGKPARMHYLEIAKLAK